MKIIVTLVLIISLQAHAEEIEPLVYGKKLKKLDYADEISSIFAFRSGEPVASAKQNSFSLPDFLPYNDIVSRRTIYPGSTVTRKYRVRKGDSLYKIAKKYKTHINTIKRYNGFKSNTIQIGQVIKVPQKVRSSVAKKIIHRRIFIDPVNNARITSRYGHRRNPFNRYRRNFHAGIDIAGSVGKPIRASADGVVEFSGRNGGYGNTVIINHNNGYQTIYAHCADLTVEQGETIRKGQVIGAIGRTGTATGSHLHFAVKFKGRFINPSYVLAKTVKIVQAVNKVAKI